MPIRHLAAAAIMLAAPAAQAAVIIDFTPVSGGLTRMSMSGDFVATNGGFTMLNDTIDFTAFFTHTVNPQDDFTLSSPASPNLSIIGASSGAHGIGTLIIDDNNSLGASFADTFYIQLDSPMAVGEVVSLSGYLDMFLPGEIVGDGLTEADSGPVGTYAITRNQAATTPVPLPAAAPALLAGLGALALAGRRRRG